MVGEHVEGEEESFSKTGAIPAFTPHFSLNVTPPRNDLEKRFTYLKVEYYSTLSTVNITFNENTSILLFYIWFPFMEIPYGVVGYSLKLPRSRVWTSWRKSLRKSKGVNSKHSGTSLAKELPVVL